MKGLVTDYLDKSRVNVLATGGLMTMNGDEIIAGLIAALPGAAAERVRTR